MSPDPPLLDQHIADPQSWNLYSYAKNNPLSYVDPTGNAVELYQDDEEERKRALARLQQEVANKEAASRMYINTVQDGDKTRYFVGIKGDLGDFAKLGDAAKGLADMVGAKQVVEFGVTSQELPGAGKGQGGYTYAPGEIGNANPRVMINPSEVAGADSFSRNTFLGQQKFGPGEIGELTTGVAISHEFGHVWHMWQNINAGQDPRSYTSPEALRWENRMRQQLYGPLGPNNAARKVH